MNARWGIALFIGVPLAILVGVILLVSQAGIVPPAPDERVVAVVPSPDGSRGATVVEIVAEAPKVEGYVVRVGGEEAFATFGGGPIRVRWRDARTLEVAFDTAKGTRMRKVENLLVVVKGRVER